MDVETFIGVDVSKHWLDFAVITNRSKSILKFKSDNNTNAFKELILALRSNHIVIGKKVLFTLEHTRGAYGQNFVKFVQRKRCNVCLESALRIKKSLGLHRGKNDALDAERILDYSIKNKEKLFLWKEPRKPISLLKDLLTNRERLIRIASSLIVPLREIKTKYKPSEWLKIMRINQTGVEGVKTSIKKLDEEIIKIAHSDKKIKRQLDLLKSVPGIGWVIALQLICKTNEFTTYQTGKQLACLAGVAPFEYSSGLSTGKGHVSFYANKNLKKYIHIGALSIIKVKTSEMRKYYDRKVAEGKHKMLVLNNIRNKILLRAAAVIRKGEPYKPVL